MSGWVGDLLQLGLLPASEVIALIATGIAFAATAYSVRACLHHLVMRSLLGVRPVHRIRAVRHSDGHSVGQGTIGEKGEERRGERGGDRGGKGGRKGEER